MDPEETLCADNNTWINKPSFSNFNSQHQFPNPNHPSGARESSMFPHPNHPSGACESNNIQDWDPTAMLNNLSFLETKIHQLQDLVHIIVNRKSQNNGQDEILVQQKQLMITDLTSIIVQLMSTAWSLFPSVKQKTPLPESTTTQLAQFSPMTTNQPNKGEDQSDIAGFFGSEENFLIEDHDMKSDDEAENLPPGSYEILQLEKEEILAPHTHFCTICGKGFKRDANLRMHMRGHGDEYKTLAALAKPHKEPSSEPILIKRYSCPSVGCKRNKDHKKFLPLKTILCAKNHYKRTHCDKTYTCSRCNTKKFSVLADLKTHEKHCGRDKWLCSCGTTFSRKDKLFGHIALFQGHTPVIPVEECNKGYVGPSNKAEQMEFNYKSEAPGTSTCKNVMNGVEGSGEDPISYFSPLDFDTSGIGGFSEFTRGSFEDSESSFSFLLSGTCDYSPKNGGYGNNNNGCSDDME